MDVKYSCFFPLVLMISFNSSADIFFFSAKKLTKVYTGNIRAVDNLDLEVEAGQIFGFLGPNGAGKTSTLRMLATLLPIDSGGGTVNG